jgi:hypothetical protein
MECPGEVMPGKGRVQMTEGDFSKVEAYLITHVYPVRLKNNPGLKNNFCTPVIYFINPGERENCSLR